MPTIWYEQGFRFSFYSSDAAERPHVHVDKGGAEGKWWLDPIQEARNSGFNARDRSTITRIIRDRQGFFLEAWERFFRGA